MQHSRTSILLSLLLWFLAVSANGQTNSRIGTGNLLLNPGAEPADPESIDGWFRAHRPVEGLRMWRDTEKHRSGKSSFAIVNTYVYDHPVCNNWAQILENVPPGKMLQLSAYIKTEDAAAANVCVQCIGDDLSQGFLQFASTPTVRGTHDWMEYKSKAFVVPDGTKKVCIRAALCGTGSARFDDIRLYELVANKSSKDESTNDLGLSDEVPKKKLEELARGRILEMLPIKKDCMVLSYMPDWNHGQVDNIAVANYKGGVRSLFCWEDVPESMIAQSKNRFMLAIYARGNNGPGRSKSAEINVFEIQEEWPERSPSNKQPKYSDMASVHATFTNDSGWKLLDVTDLVREQASDNRSNFGVVLRFPDERIADSDSFQLAFASREASGEWEDFRPALLVVAP